MISGTAKRALRTLAAWLLPAAAWCAAPDLDAFVSRLARPAPATTPFVEVRFSRLLTKPLVVSGELEYLGPRALARSVKAPFQERTEIQGTTVTVQRGERTRRFSLKRAPELSVLLDSFAALLGGDRTALERQFTLELQGDEHAWTLLMNPRDARVKQRIRDIVVTGSENEPRCLITTEPDDDASLLLMATAASLKLPASVQRAWLDEQCHAPRA